MNYLQDELYRLVQSDQHIFEFIQKSALDGLWYWDLEKPENEWMNARFWETLGYDPAEMPHKVEAWQSIIFSEDLESARDLITRHLEDPSSPYDQILRYRHKTGKTIWVRCRGIAIRDEQGKPLRMIGAHANITEQMVLQKQLGDQVKWFESIIDGARLGTWKWNIDTDEVQINSQMAELLGYELRELSDLNRSSWMSIVHPGDQDAFATSVDQYLKEPIGSLSIEFRAICKDKSIIWVQAIGQNVESGSLQQQYWLSGVFIDHTSHKELESDIRESLELTELFISQAPTAIAMFDTQMRYLAASKQWLSDYGLEGAEIIGISHYEVFPEIGEDWKEIHRRCLSGAIDRVDEAPFERSDGTTQWLTWEVRPWYINGSTVGGLLMYTADITRIKERENLLLHYKFLLERSNQVAKIGTWGVDLSNQSVEWSDVTREIHEVAADYQPTFGKGVEFYIEEDRETLTSAFARCAEAGDEFDLELRILTPAGREKWIRVIGIAEMEGPRCIRVFGLFQDIDDSKRSTEKLRAQEELFRKTFEYAGIGMALVGLNGKWLEVNTSVTGFLGYTKEELMGLTFQDITYPDDLNKDLDELNQLLAGEKIHYQIEKRYIHKEGHILWALLSVSLVKDDQGNPVHFVSQISDITKQKQLLETTADQNKRLLNFAHIVSHNLRSHTGNIEMLLSILGSEVDQISENEWFGLLNQASGNLTQTIEHLHEVVEINTKTFEQLVSVDLAGFVNDTAASVSGLLKSVNGEIDIQMPSDLKAMAIPAYLQSAVGNLLTNAIKYRNPDKDLEVRITAESLPEHVRLHICDNGLGIDLEAHGDKLFGMYKTFHNNADSRGIGLFITKNQVQAMGGTINVESEVMNGTCFTLTLQHGKN